MKQLKSLFAAAGRTTRTACIAATGAVVASPAFAALDTTAVEAAMGAAKDDAWSIANLAIPVIVVLAVAGIIYALIRKV